MKFKYVILDLDGPILEGKFRHHACYSAILKEDGFEPLTLEKYWELKRGGVDRRRQLSESGAEKIYDLFLKKWTERIEQAEFLALDRLQPGAVEQLTKWRDEGRTLILSTLRSRPALVEIQLKQLGIFEVFHHVVVASHAQGGEGKASSVLKIIPGLQPEHAVWIGDTEIDLEGAKTLGCLSWLTSCGVRNADYLARLKPTFLSTDLQSVRLS